MDQTPSRLELRNNLVSELYAKYRDKVSARVRATIGGETPDAEDIVSDIFVALIEFLASSHYRNEATIGTILYRITGNKIMDHLRKKYRGHPRNLSPEELINLASSDLFETTHENRALFDRVMGKLSVLTPQQRTAFLLHGVAGMTLKEVASRMDRAESRVQHLYDRAKEKLASALRNIWEEAAGEAEAGLDRAALVEWLDKAFNAYARLGKKIEHWDDGMAVAAEAARRKIRQIIEDAP